LDFVADAQVVEGPEPFTTDLLDRLAAVTESDFATYKVVDASLVANDVYVPCSYETQARFTPPDHWVQPERYEGDVFTWSDRFIGDPGCGSSRRRGPRSSRSSTPSTSSWNAPCSAWPATNAISPHATGESPRRFVRTPLRSCGRRAAGAVSRLSRPLSIPPKRATQVASSFSEAATSSSTRLLRRGGSLLTGSATVSAGGCRRASATGSHRSRAPSTYESKATARDSSSKHPREAL
jgi:hypothetical protein